MPDGKEGDSGLVRTLRRFSRTRRAAVGTGSSGDICLIIPERKLRSTSQFLPLSGRVIIPQIFVLCHTIESNIKYLAHSPSDRRRDIDIVPFTELINPDAVPKILHTTALQDQRIFPTIALDNLEGVKTVIYLDHLVEHQSVIKRWLKDRRQQPEGREASSPAA